MIEIGLRSDKRKKKSDCYRCAKSKLQYFLSCGCLRCPELLILRLLFLLHLIPLEPDWSQMTGFGKSWHAFFNYIKWFLICATQCSIKTSKLHTSCDYGFYGANC